MRSNALLIDYNNLLWRSIAVNGNLSFEGTFTGGLYGFVRQLCVYLRDSKPRNVAVVADSPPYLRKQEFDGYKGDRAERQRKRPRRASA